MELLSHIFFLLILGILSFLFSGIEAGFLALNPVRIRSLARSHSQAAEKLKAHLENPEPFLWAILIGNTAANCAILAEGIYLLNRFHSAPVYVIVPLGALCVFVFYTFLDLLPKMLVRRFPNRMTVWLTYPFEIFYWALSPLVITVSALRKAILSDRSSPSSPTTPFKSRRDLHEMIQQDAPELTAGEKVLIDRVMKLEEKTVQLAMKPIDAALLITRGTALQRALSVSQKSGRTRLLVRENREASAKTIGIFHLKLALFERNLHNSSRSIDEFTTPCMSLQSNTPLDEALQHFKNAQQRLAVVLDNNHREIGVISLDDILRNVFREMTL